MQPMDPGVELYSSPGVFPNHTVHDDDIILPAAIRMSHAALPPTSAEENSASSALGVEAPSTEIDTRMPVEEVLARLHTNIETGLTDEEAAARLLHHGPNKISPPTKRHAIVKVLIEMSSGFSALLWLAAALCFLAYSPFGSFDGATPDPVNLYLGYILVGIVVSSSVFNVYQEVQTDNVLESFQESIPKATVVLRNGKRCEVPIETLVVGDIVCVSVGVNAPADLRCLTASSLRIDKSALTGESVPVPVVTSVTSSDATIIDANNMLLLGTRVVEGLGLGVVIRVGDECSMAGVVRMSASDRSTPSTLHVEIRRVVILISVCALIAGCAVVIIWLAWLKPTYPGYYRETAVYVNTTTNEVETEQTYVGAFMPFSALFGSLVSVMVGFLPDGLPTAVTITLALIARKLVKKHGVMVTKLAMVETLGCTSLIVSDKTGTITANVMSLRHASLARGVMIDMQDGPCALQLYDSDDGRALLQAAALCNEAVLNPVGIHRPAGADADEAEEEERKLDVPRRKAAGGGALDNALLLYMDNLLSAGNIRGRYSKVAEIPFNSASKYMVSVHLDDRAGCYFVILKGALEMVMKRCSSALVNGRVCPISESIASQAAINEETLGNKAERVIGLARRYLDADQFPTTGFEFQTDPPNFPLEELTFLGLLSLADPPRPGVKAAVTAMRGAGVQIAMCTGDHKSTALSISREVGIIQSEVIHTMDNLPRPPPGMSPIPVTKADFRSPQSRSDHAAVLVLGHQVEGLTDYAWKWIFSHSQIVFARMSPAGKRIAVQQAQLCNHTVAVTGDGVNDAPALKTADIGVAMGSGSDVARHSADIVLLKDDFKGLCHGVLHGRLAFENLKKVLVYVLPAGSFAELLAILIYVIVGTPTFLSSFQMIVICCATDFLSCLALVYEPPESDLMRREPRNVQKERLIDWKLLLYAYGLQGVFYVLGVFVIISHYLSEQGHALSDWIWAFNTPANNNPLTTDEIHSAQSLYYVGLVIFQMVNLLSTRTRFTPIFFRCFNKSRTLHGGEETELAYSKLNLRGKLVFRVKELFPLPIVLGMVSSLFLVVFLTYYSGVQETFHTRAVSPIYGLYFLAWGMGIAVIADLRKVCLQVWPNGVIAKCAW